MNNLYIPEHLKKIPILKYLEDMVVEYEEGCDSEGNNWKEDVNTPLSIWREKEEQDDPVRVYVEKYVVVDDFNSEEEYTNVVNYITAKFYSVKGTAKVFDYMKSLLDISFVDEPVVSNEELIISLEEDDYDNDIFTKFLEALLYFKDSSIELQEQHITIEKEFSGELKSSIVVYKVFGVIMVIPDEPEPEPVIQEFTIPLFPLKTFDNPTEVTYERFKGDWAEFIEYLEAENLGELGINIDGNWHKLEEIPEEKTEFECSQVSVGVKFTYTTQEEGGEKSRKINSFIQEHYLCVRNPLDEREEDIEDTIYFSDTKPFFYDWQTVQLEYTGNSITPRWLTTVDAKFSGFEFIEEGNETNSVYIDHDTCENLVRESGTSRVIIKACVLDDYCRFKDEEEFSEFAVSEINRTNAIVKEIDHSLCITAREKEDFDVPLMNSSMEDIGQGIKEFMLYETDPNTNGENSNLIDIFVAGGINTLKLVVEDKDTSEELINTTIDLSTISRTTTKHVFFSTIFESPHQINISTYFTTQAFSYEEASQEVLNILHGSYPVHRLVDCMSSGREYLPKYGKDENNQYMYRGYSYFTN